MLHMPIHPPTPAPVCAPAPPQFGVPLSAKGLPLRPGMPVCAFYVKV
jgi:hypothetical protein